jgi:hypothetical protein
MSLVRETTICSEARTVMTNKIVVIKPRKYLRPYDSRDRVKDIVLPLNLRGVFTEFAFYGQKMLNCFSLTSRRARDL